MTLKRKLGIFLVSIPVVLMFWLILWFVIHIIGVPHPTLVIFLAALLSMMFVVGVGLISDEL